MSQSITDVRDRLLTIRELAGLLGVAVGSCYHLVCQKRIPEKCIVRLSRRCIRFRESEVWRWIESLSARGVPW